MTGRTAKDSAKSSQAEFSRTIMPDRLGAPTLTESLEAAPAERAAVARRLGLLAIDRLAAEVTVSNLGGRLYRVEGAWQAAVQQACVVTLEPVRAALEGRLQAAFEAGDERSGADEVVVDPEAADPAEVLPAEGIDLGELVVQELAVALDPYPRIAGAAVPPEYRPPEDEEASGPFAALKALKVKK